MKHNTSWNLKLLYKNDGDIQIEKDIKNIEQACAVFEKKYKKASFTTSPSTLKTALREYEKLKEKIGAYKPWWYFALKTDIDSEDNQSRARATKYEQRISNATNRIAFFVLDIAKIPLFKQKIFLKHTSLAPYAYFLIRIFKRAKYNLSEGEEQLDELLSQTSYTMWVDAQERLLNRQIIKYKGKNIPIMKAITELSELPKKDRKEIHDKINLTLKSVSYMAENELNAVYNYKKTMDERRGFKNPYSATILEYGNSEKSIEAFVSLVSRYFKISQRFYKIHAHLLKEKKITMADRNAKIGKIKTTFDFQTSVAMFRSTLGKIDSEYVSFFDSFLENGQIDVYPKKGKRGGAYCWGMGNLPTFVLLNHVNDVRSLETLAHEMGHAIHTELSKRQTPLYRGYSTATAEVASTFFEQAVSEAIEERLSEEERIILLHNKVMGDVSTIFRQIACFNFEKELHQIIREKGHATAEEMADAMTKHLKSYTGDAVSVTPDDGYYFVYWSHIRRFFYVYTYAYGQLVSKALYEKWKENPSYAKKIKQFLSAGNSASPEDIFRKIGIDTSRSTFFEEGLKAVEKDILKLERLSKTRRKRGV